ncbi:hypothetical protein TKK_0001626 [Trichogramma kaykai]
MESFFKLNNHYSNWEEFDEEVKVYEATYDFSLVIEDSRLVVPENSSLNEGGTDNEERESEELNSTDDETETDQDKEADREASYNRYARCHTEDWNTEVGEEISICEECHRPIDTPAQYLYGPLHM